MSVSLINLDFQLLKIGDTLVRQQIYLKLITAFLITEKATVVMEVMAMKKSMMNMKVKRIMMNMRKKKVTMLMKVKEYSR